MTREEIANILKIERQKAGLTQKQAAESLGRKQQTLASWETGQSQPDANTLFELFELYGSSIDEAFEFTKKDWYFSKHEKTIISAYRSNPEMQAAIDKLLGVVDQSSETVKVFRAARSEEDKEPGQVDMPKTTIRVLEEGTDPTEI